MIRQEVIARDPAFWERLVEMPDLEAEELLIHQLEMVALENAMLLAERINAQRSEAAELGVSMLNNQAVQTRLNAELKFRRKRMERVKWENAVKALFGQEGADSCRLWMELNRKAA